MNVNECAVGSFAAIWKQTLAIIPMRIEHVHHQSKKYPVRVVRLSAVLRRCVKGVIWQMNGMR